MLIIITLLLIGYCIVLPIVIKQHKNKKQVNHLKDQLGGLAHDVRNNLATMQCATDLYYIFTTTI